MRSLGAAMNWRLVLRMRFFSFLDKQKNLVQITAALKNNFITPTKASKFSIKIAKDGVKRSALEILGMKEVNLNLIRSIWADIPHFGHQIDYQVEIDAHYMGYLERQSRDIKSFQKDEAISIPLNVNYNSLSGLSNEIKSKLKNIRPKTLGQAIRIDGVTPAAVIIILSHLKRSKIKETA